MDYAERGSSIESWMLKKGAYRAMDRQVLDKAKKGDVKGLSRAIDMGGSLLVTDRNENNLLHLTTDLQTLSFILERDKERSLLNEYNNQGVTPLFVAIERMKSQMPIPYLLLAEGGVLDLKPITYKAFYEACGQGDIQNVKRGIADSSIDINQKNHKDRGATPFYIACAAGKTEIVQLLLQEKHIQVNQDEEHGATPFLIACQNGHTEIVQLLFQHKCTKVNQAAKSGATPFFIACHEGETETVQLLLQDKRIEVNQAAKSVATLFLIVCRNGHTETVQLLLQDKRVEVN